MRCIFYASDAATQELHSWIYDVSWPCLRTNRKSLERISLHPPSVCKIISSVEHHMQTTPLTEQQMAPWRSISQQTARLEGSIGAKPATDRCGGSGVSNTTSSPNQQQTISSFAATYIDGCAYAFGATSFALWKKPVPAEQPHPWFGSSNRPRGSMVLAPVAAAALAKADGRRPIFNCLVLLWLSNHKLQKGE